MPAKDAASVSSAVAEERTATGGLSRSPASSRYASRISCAISSGTGSSSTITRTSLVARSSSAVSSTSTEERRSSILSRRPPTSQKMA